MKYIIWGAGLRGESIFHFLGGEKVQAFIDSDPNKTGTYYCNKKIINFDEYIKHYSDYFIIVSALKSDEILNQLQNNNIYHFFMLDENPAELQGFGIRNLFDESLLAYNKNDMIGIYGLTLFGILLYEHLKYNGCENIYLIPHKGCLLNLILWIKEHKAIYNVVKLYEVEKKLDKMLVVYEDDVFDGGNKNYIIENTYDFSDRITHYHNDKIEKLRNININSKRCFIVATGPSLTVEDLDVLMKNSEISISMNSIFTAYKDTEWRTDYYVVGDGKIIEQFEDEICDLKAKVKLISDRYMPFWDGNKNEDVLKFHVAVVPKFCYRMKFSEDFAQTAYAYGSTTYACIQLAVYLGFKEIILLGVDFNYTNNPIDPQNHFNGEYYKITKSNAVQYENSLMEYKWAREYAQKNNIKIYNATRGGKLEIFERVDFDKLF